MFECDLVLMNAIFFSRDFLFNGEILHFKIGFDKIFTPTFRCLIFCIVRKLNGSLLSPERECQCRSPACSGE